LDPTFAKPHNNLGNALLNKGDRNAAIREYSTAIRLDPSYKVAHYNLAIELERRGDVKQAAEHYLAACPTYASAYCPAAASQGLSDEQCEKQVLDCLHGPPGWRRFNCVHGVEEQGCEVPHGIL
jgi:tetratricopeptide (TPR) repeat protein